MYRGSVLIAFLMDKCIYGFAVYCDSSIVQCVVDRFACKEKDLVLSGAYQWGDLIHLGSYGLYILGSKVDIYKETRNLQMKPNWRILKEVVSCL